jgi:hypothetical protein
MRNAFGNDNHVSFVDAPILAALDFFPANFMGCDGLWIDGGAAGHEGGGTFQHVDDIRVASMDFSDSGSVATAGVHFELVILMQRHSFGEGGGDRVAPDKGRIGGRLGRGGEGKERQRAEEGEELKRWFHGRRVSQPKTEIKTPPR